MIWAVTRQKEHAASAEHRANTGDGGEQEETTALTDTGIEPGERHARDNDVARVDKIVSAKCITLEPVYIRTEKIILGGCCDPERVKHTY